MLGLLAPTGSVIQQALPYLQRFGYWAVFGAILLEDFGLPLPGETLLIASSLLSAEGVFHIEWVIFLAFWGAVIGDNIGYAIGYHGGRRFILRYGRYVFIKPGVLEKAEDFFESHGGKVVMIARFIEILRQLNGIVAGISRMPWRRFVLFNMIGAALWVGFWGGVGFFLGNKIDLIHGGFRRLELYLLIGFVAFVVLAVIFRTLLHHRRGNRRQSRH